MMSLTAQLKRNKGYFILYALFLLGWGVIQLFFSQTDLFLAINSTHNSFSDFFFYWITYLGDGLACVAVILVLLFIRYWQAILGIIVFLLSGLIAQLLKRFVFSEYRRPFAELNDQYDLYSVPGVEQVLTLSFPSGHTVTAFALTFFISSLTGTSNRSWWFCLLAIMIGFSRIYLGQHYMIDVYVGSIIGVLTALLVIVFLEEPLKQKLGRKSLLNR